MRYTKAPDTFERVEDGALEAATAMAAGSDPAGAAEIGVMTLIRSGVMTQLNLSGRRIWELLSQSRTACEIAGVVAAEYGIAAEACLDDVESFLNDLHAKGFVVHEDE